MTPNTPTVTHEQRAEKHSLTQRFLKSPLYFMERGFRGEVNVGVLAIMLIILLVATAVRLHDIGAQSMWHDEGVSYRLALRTWSESARVISSEVHVPGYFWTLNVWVKLTGETEFAMRSLSAFFSIVGVAFTFALGRRLFGSVAGIAAAAFVALNTFSIYYAQEMRMYAMMTALGAASMWFFVDFIKTRTWFPAIAFGLLNVAGWSMHYSYPYLIAAQGILIVLWLGAEFSTALKTQPESSVGATYQVAQMRVALRRIAPALGKYIAANLLTIVIFLPWIVNGIKQFDLQPNISPYVPMDQLQRMILGWFSFGKTFEHSIGGMGVAVYFFLLFGLMILPAQAKQRRAWWWMLLPVVWVLTSTLIYLYLELYARYLRQLLPAQIGFALWMGRGVWVLWTAQTRERRAPIKYLPRFAAAFGTMGLLVNMAGGLNPLYTRPEFRRDDYRGMAQRIVAEMRPGDAIILDAPNQAEVFRYYYDGDIPVFSLPASADDAQTLADTRQVIANYDRIFALMWGMDEQDPNHVVENTLNQEAFQIGDEWYGDVRFVRYATPAEFGDMKSSGTRFGESITLAQYGLNGETFQAGDALQVRLDWQTSAPLDQRLKVFVQLLYPDGTLAAQRDSEPGGGLKLTTTWTPGAIVTDNHALMIPANLPSGNYTLIIGLYDINDPQARLAVGDGSYLQLGKVEIAEK